MRTIYTLTDWVVEDRPDGWYYSTYNDRRNKLNYKLPYSSEASVALMLARELCQEIKRRIQTVDAA